MSNHLTYLKPIMSVEVDPLGCGNVNDFEVPFSWRVEHIVPMSLLRYMTIEDIVFLNIDSNTLCIHSDSFNIYRLIQHKHSSTLSAMPISDISANTADHPAIAKTIISFRRAPLPTELPGHGYIMLVPVKLKQCWQVKLCRGKQEFSDNYHTKQQFRRAQRFTNLIWLYELNISTDTQAPLIWIYG